MRCKRSVGANDIVVKFFLSALFGIKYHCE